MRSRIGMSALGLLCLVGAAAPVGAETILAPYVGSTFGAGATDSFGDTSHLVYGGTISFLGEGAVGFELDGQYSPNFFGDGGNEGSLMGEITIGGGELKGTRFFVAAGAGILESRIRNTSGFVDADRNSFGIELGASLVVPVSRSLGVKGDVRYFRGLTNVKPDTVGDIDLSGFHFWRASAGLAIRL
jgi:hypothetical protein